MLDKNLRIIYLRSDNYKINICT
jgi:hypothetical protein